MRRAITLLLSLSCVAIPALLAADQPASPFTQAGAPPAAGDVNDLEFAGVSTVGQRTMINLYDKQQKRSFWVQAGQTSGGVTVVKYDGEHDQVTVRRNGAEKLIPLRPPSAVVNGSSAPTPLPQPGEVAVASPDTAATTATTSTASLSQARQEEEARMLVSDLLEIGMAQRKAYEEKMRQAKAGGGNAPAPAPNAPPVQQPTPAAPSQQQPAPNTATQP